MASRQSSAGAEAKHSDIRQIDQEFVEAEQQELKRRKPRSERWTGGPSGTVFKQIRLLAAAAELIPPALSRGALCNRLCQRMKDNGTLPDKTAGKGASVQHPSPWNKGTFVGFLRGQKTNPDEGAQRQIRDELKAILSARYEQAGRIGDPIDEVLSASLLLPSDYLLALLGSVAKKPEGVFVRSADYISVRIKGFDSEPIAAWPQPLEKMASDIHGAIEKADGASLVLVSGPHMSGKKTCLKFLCRKLEGELRLDDGATVPYLALALDELEPGEFLDTILAFYRPGDPEPSLLNRDAGLSSAAKIEEILRISKSCPACLILADLEPVENDAVLRSLHQDHVAQVLLGLFKGHSATRLILTGPATGGLAALEREAKRRGIRSKTFELTDRLRVDLDTLAVVTDGEGGREVGAFTYQAAKIADRLASERNIKGLRSIHRSLERDDRATILRTLWDNILEPYERFFLGAVASVADGLRASVLARMALSRFRFDEAEWLSNGLTNPSQIEEVAKGLAEIVQVREVVPDLGQRGFREASSEPLFYLDQGWRRQLQRMWFGSETDLARNCSWLIAREAAQQARVLKMRGGPSNSRSAFARDVQAFVALVASVDPSKVGKKITADRFWALEATVLPELDENASEPDGRTVLRYAFLRLYRDYLEGSDYRLLQELDDPDLRLRLLLPFFEPSKPWLASSERNLSDTLESYNFLYETFSPRELLDLLTAVALAALRLQRYGLLRAAVRLGEQLLSREKHSELYPKAVRLLRSEIDAGIYAGGNAELLPDRPGEKSERNRQSAREDDGRHKRRGRGGPRLAQTEKDYTFSHVVHLIQKAEALFPATERTVDVTFARGKILARLGEAHLLAGNLDESVRAFFRALYAEKKIAKLEGSASHPGTVMGGRGARAFVAVLMETAKCKIGNKSKGIVFKSGLRLPLPPVVNELDNCLALARAMLAVNIRRVNALDTADRLGHRIDLALLAAVQGNYLLATDMLEQIEETPLHRGTNAELAMEMTSQRARIYMEAALLMIHYDNGQAEWPVDHWMHQLQIKLRKETAGELFDPVEVLIARAESTLSALRELVKTADAHFLPIGSLLRYLLATLDILKTRGLERADAVTSLTKAQYRLEQALGHFKDSEFLRYQPEAERIRDQLAEFVGFGPVRSA